MPLKKKDCSSGNSYGELITSPDVRIVFFFWKMDKNNPILGIYNGAYTFHT
jgi:hypothetical protein